MADALGVGEVRAAALINIGSARAALGDDRGLDEIAHGVEVARAANAAFEMCRGMGNLAARLWARGQLAEAKQRWREAEREAENYGQKGFARWFHGVLVPPEVEFGEWDAAAARADAFIADIEAGSPHYLGSQAYIHRAMIRLGSRRDRRRRRRRRARPRAGAAGEGSAGRLPGLCRGGARVHGDRRAGARPGTGRGVPRRRCRGKSARVRGGLPPRALLDAHRGGARRGVRLRPGAVHPVPLCQDRARLRPRRPGRRRRSVRRDRRARLRGVLPARCRPRRRPHPARAVRSRSTARSARRATCARARRCSPPRPSCRSA